MSKKKINAEFYHDDNSIPYIDQSVHFYGRVTGDTASLDTYTDLIGMSLSF